MTNVALTTLTKVGRMASHGVTLGVTKGVKKGVKLKLIASLHLVIREIYFEKTCEKLVALTTLLQM